MLGKKSKENMSERKISSIYQKIHAVVGDKLYSAITICNVRRSTLRAHRHESRFLPPRSIFLSFPTLGQRHQCLGYKILDKYS